MCESVTPLSDCLSYSMGPRIQSFFLHAFFVWLIRIAVFADPYTLPCRSLWLVVLHSTDLLTRVVLASLDTPQYGFTLYQPYIQYISDTLMSHVSIYLRDMSREYCNQTIPYFSTRRERERAR
jgi:hypothetical protein